MSAALAHQPDAVIISNPTALHLDIAIPAAEAGCSILMEKPVSDHFERISDLQKALEHGGGRMLVGFQFRFHPTLRQVDHWLKAGEIGKIISARVHWGEYLPAWHPWEDYRIAYSARADLGGGVVNTLSHPLDYLHWLLGEVSDLWAFTGHKSGLELEVEDTAEIGLLYRSGAIASVHLDYVQRPPQHTLEIIGNLGTIQWENASGTARLYRAATESWIEINPPKAFDRNQLFLDEMSHFLNVVKKQETPCCTLQDGIVALQLAQAVYQSARTKQLVKLVSNVSG